MYSIGKQSGRRALQFDDSPLKLQVKIRYIFYL